MTIGAEGALRRTKNSYQITTIQSGRWVYIFLGLLEETRWVAIQPSLTSATVIVRVPGPVTRRPYPDDPGPEAGGPMAGANDDPRLADLSQEYSNHSPAHVVLLLYRPSLGLVEISWYVVAEIADCTSAQLILYVAMMDAMVNGCVAMAI